MNFSLKILLVFIFAMPVLAMDFSLQHPEDIKEQYTLDLLKALRAVHDLDKWEFTDKVHIDKTSIPHSHPILTLHARHGRKNQKDMLLSTYLHEQIHWLTDENIESTNLAIGKLKIAFSKVPVGFPEGARNEDSTYLHLIVCYLELKALGDYLSESRVKTVLEFWKKDHYTWIYHQVELHQDLIAKIITESGLTLGDKTHVSSKN
tara:strand:- start:907 stop:1521 length:615 start_codon:yes stop_codon:yes gene_type:complete